MELSECTRVHFIGIGGISMSGLAEILHDRGFTVSGSDMACSSHTSRLADMGMEIEIGHRAENITPDTELVVYTAAVARDNPELIAAEDMGLPVLDRAELLGKLADEYSYSVCVAGTHGKTTTTSMITEMFVSAGVDPTVTVGGILPSIGGNIRIGASDYFIAEACEYCDSFLKLKPYVGVILNVDLDHIDYFKDLHQMLRSFRTFAHGIRPGGTLVINAGIESLSAITAGLDRKILTYGAKTADLYANDINYDDDGCASFEPVYNGRGLGRVSLNVPGSHNVNNALAAIGAGLSLGLETHGLTGFGGVQRRFEIKGRFNGSLVVDDYAHHPAEIKATISAARRRRYNKLRCVFQPHTYSRTRELLTELSQAFDGADEVLMVDIYAAREQDHGDIHSLDLVERIRSRGIDCRYFPDFGSVEKFLSDVCIPNDMLITMGAGDVYLIGEALVNGSY